MGQGWAGRHGVGGMVVCDPPTPHSTAQRSFDLKIGVLENTGRPGGWEGGSDSSSPTHGVSGIPAQPGGASSEEDRGQKGDTLLVMDGKREACPGCKGPCHSRTLECLNSQFSILVSNPSDPQWWPPYLVGVLRRRKFFFTAAVDPQFFLPNIRGGAEWSGPPPPRGGGSDLPALCTRQFPASYAGKILWP